MFVLAYVALLGAVLGSFLNVCILRWGAEPKQSVMRPPSRCPDCGHAIRWYENIPIAVLDLAAGPMLRLRHPDLAAVPRGRGGDGAPLGGIGRPARSQRRGARARGRVDPPARHRGERRPGLHHPARVLPRRHRDRARLRRLARQPGGVGGRGAGRAVRGGAGAAGRRGDRAGAGAGGDGRRRLRADGHGGRLLRMGGGLAGARARGLRRAAVSPAGRTASRQPDGYRSGPRSVPDPRAGAGSARRRRPPAPRVRRPSRIRRSPRVSLPSRVRHTASAGESSFSSWPAGSRWADCWESRPAPGCSPGCSAASSSPRSARAPRTTSRSCRRAG